MRIIIVPGCTGAPAESVAARLARQVAAAGGRTAAGCRTVVVGPAGGPLGQVPEAVVGSLAEFLAGQPLPSPSLPDQYGTTGPAVTVLAEPDPAALALPDEAARAALARLADAAGCTLVCLPDGNPAAAGGWARAADAVLVVGRNDPAAVQELGAGLLAWTQAGLPLPLLLIRQSGAGGVDPLDVARLLGVDLAASLPAEDESADFDGALAPLVELIAARGLAPEDRRNKLRERLRATLRHDREAGAREPELPPVGGGSQPGGAVAQLPPLAGRGEIEEAAMAGWIRLRTEADDIIARVRETERQLAQLYRRMAAVYVRMAEVFGN